METIYTQLSELIAAGEIVAVGTIVSVRGSAPREVGAKIIVHPLGRHIGTVGGGCGEADVIRAGLEVIHTGQPAVVRIDLTEDISMQSLGVCGGILDVLVEQASAAPRPDGMTTQTWLAALQTSMAAREPVALATVIRGPQPGRHAVIWLDRAPLGQLALGSSELETRILADARDTLAGRQHRLLRYHDRQLLPGAPGHATADDEIWVFVEVQRRAPELIIVGAGHIALPLAQLGSLCDFAVTVLDDRPTYANPARFPTARRVISAPLTETVRDLPLDHDSFVVLVTRGHSQDVECLLEVLDRPVAYIGMIGSKRRVEAVFELLSTEQGIDPAKFDRIYAPIGLDIGARTPAEIAVCIMAEIVNVLRGGPAPSLSDGRRARAKNRRAGSEA
jgi:xanthine dehydrogenase accessory factor